VSVLANQYPISLPGDIQKDLIKMAIIKPAEVKKTGRCTECRMFSGRKPLFFCKDSGVSGE
jgi:hypothetical protein